MNSYIHRDSDGRPGGVGGESAPRVMAFVDDAATARTLASLYRERGHKPPEIFEGGLDAALESHDLRDDLDMLIVDVDSTLLPIADIGALRTVLPDSVRLAALGSHEDLDYSRELIAAGASVYLVKPLSRERMEKLVFGGAPPAPARATDPAPPAHQRITERHVAVIGARGGLGATSLAVNLAATIAERSRQPSLLLDLDLQFGTALLSLNLQPTQSLADMLRRPERIDNVLVRHSVQEAGRHLAVLGAEEPLEALPEIGPSAMATLMGEIGAIFRYVIVDIPAHRLDLIGPGLADATDVVLVGDLTLAGVRDTLRMLGQVQEHAPAAAHRHIVIGGASDVRHATMTQRQFEESVGQKVAALLPHDPATFSEAGAAGRPVVSLKPGSKPAKAYARLADHFLPRDRKPGRGLFGFRTTQATRAAG